MIEKERNRNVTTATSNFCLVILIASKNAIDANRQSNATASIDVDGWLERINVWSWGMWNLVRP
jgi:hypothetical protein